MKTLIISLGIFCILALNVEPKYINTLKALQDRNNDEITIKDYPESDFVIIYQEPFIMSQMDPFYRQDQNFGPALSNFWSPFNFNPILQDPFGFNPFNVMPSLMSKMMNTFPGFKNSNTRKSDNNFKLRVQSCDSIESELRNSDDNYQSNNLFSYHYESSTCNCNQTNFCKISFSKPNLDFCYLNEIKNEERLSNCDLLEYCENENDCDGIYVDHRFNKYFSVVCEGKKEVPNVSAKSAKQFVLQLKNCL